MADSAQPATLDVVVVGRANADVTVHVPHRPAVGRTVFASEMAVTAGGKSLNQAVAVAHSGGRVGLVSNAGADDWGRMLLRTLKQAAVDVSCFHLLPAVRTGAAIVEVTPDGESYVILAVSAATELTAQQVLAGLDTLRAPVVVTQLDLPPEAVHTVLRHRRDQVLIGNLVPHPSLGLDVLAGLDVFVANEHEAAIILGQHHHDPIAAAEELCGRGMRAAVVTAGPRGAAYSCATGTGLIPADEVHVGDTTGAGDAFLGVLALCLSRQAPLREAVAAAVTAGTVAVQTAGPRLPAPEHRNV